MRKSIDTANLLASASEIFHDCGESCIELQFLISDLFRKCEEIDPELMVKMQAIDRLSQILMDSYALLSAAAKNSGREVILYHGSLAKCVKLVEIKSTLLKQEKLPSDKNTEQTDMELL